MAHKYYAVVRGNFTGIFNGLDEFNKATKGSKRTIAKGFDSLSSASDYMIKNGVKSSKVKKYCKKLNANNKEENQSLADKIKDIEIESNNYEGSITISSTDDTYVNNEETSYQQEDISDIDTSHGSVADIKSCIESLDRNSIIAIVDGSCDAGYSGNIASACIIYEKTNGIIKKNIIWKANNVSVSDGKITSQFVEVEAIMLALQYAKYHKKKKVVVYNDCLPALYLLNNNKGNDEKTVIYSWKYQRYLNDLDITLRYIPGHSGNFYQDEVDKLAVAVRSNADLWGIKFLEV